MKRLNSIATALAVAGLSLGLTAEALGQQQQSQSQSSQSRQVQLELPGAASILRIDADVPQEARVGDAVNYSIRIQNVSDNVAVHDLKLSIKPQKGMTIESVKLQGQNGDQNANQQNGQQQQQGSSQSDAAQQSGNNHQNSSDSQQAAARQQNQQQSEERNQNQSGNDSEQNQQAQDQQSQNETSSEQQQDGDSSGQQQKRSPDGSRQVTISKLQPGQTRTIAISATAEKEGQAMACVMVTEFAPALCLATEAVKPELELAKEAPEKARLCEPIEVEYYVKNAGSGDLEAFEVTDKLPKGLQTESGDDQLTFQVDGGLRAGDVRKFVATLQATEAGEFSSRAVAKTQNGQTTRSSKTTTKVEQAQLAVAIDGPQTVMVNQPVSYQIRVTNHGNVRADNARLRMMYPDVARLSGSGDVRNTDNKVEQNSGNAQPTAANASSRESQDSQQKQNQNASSNQQNQDENQNQQESGNSDSSQQSSASGDQNRQSASSEGSSSDSQQSANANAQAQRDGGSQQSGNDSAQQSAQQNSNQSQQNRSQDRQSREWDLGSLEPGQTKQIRVTLSPEQAEQLRTEAIADYVCAVGDRDRISSRAMTTTEVISVPALLLTVVDNEQRRDPDGRVTYTIEVRNQGTAADEQIEISAELPEGLKFVEASGDTDVTSSGQQLQIKPLEKLGPDERVRWQIQTQATTDQQQQVQFRVELTSQSLNRRVSAEEPTTLLPASTQTSAETSGSQN